MKVAIWTVANNSRINREYFESENDAIEYAKKNSAAMSNLCTVHRTAHNKMYIYENGTTVTAPRRVELSKIVEEIIMNQMTHEAKQGQKTK